MSHYACIILNEITSNSNYHNTRAAKHLDKMTIVLYYIIKEIPLSCHSFVLCKQPNM